MNDVLLKKGCHVYNIIFTKIEKHFIGIEKTLFIFLKSILKKNMCKYTKNIIIIYIYIYKYNFFKSSIKLFALYEYPFARKNMTNQ